jgi:hypothetical protein
MRHFPEDRERRLDSRSDNPPTQYTRDTVPARKQASNDSWPYSRSRSATGAVLGQVLLATVDLE